MKKSIYDDVLIARLKHLQLHPLYFPHIGDNYDVARTKTFIIAESHYVHSHHNHKISIEDWYSNPASIYSALDKRSINDKNWFNTRGVIKHYQTAEKLVKGYGLFHNLEKAYQSLNKELKLFDECVYLNYFQRPAEVEGDSINIHRIDSEVALENLLVLIETLQPNKIIFVSSKAYDDFIKNTTEPQRKNLPYIGSVPHPSASSWWNRKSPKYGLKGQSVTGKEKFLRIMKPKDLNTDNC
ncbi:MAG: hypothetical protein K2Y30_01245 [Flavobacteriaceae bacterium]|nr:hypothetical protein [Flavobacteriaceae bacterium]